MKGLQELLKERGQSLPDAEPAAIPADVVADQTAELAEQQQPERDRRQNLEVYRQYQKNIAIAGQTETEILKGLQAGENLAILFLQALHIIGLYTGNETTEKVAAETIETVYGYALGDSAAVSMTAGNVLERLQRLEQAERAANDERERMRLKQAIRAHREQLQRLGVQINQ